MKIFIALLVLSMFTIASNIPNTTSVGLAPQTGNGQVVNNQVESILNVPPSYAMMVAPTWLLKYVPEWKTVSTMYHNQFRAGDFIDNDFTKLYVIDDWLDQLYVVDMTVDTPVITPTYIGPVESVEGACSTIPRIEDLYECWTGMSGSTDGTMYALSTSCTGNSTLYTLDLATGVATIIGSNNSPCIIDIAISPTGIMYGLDVQYDTLVRIDTETGAKTTIGWIGFNANYAQDMDFDEARGILYLAAYNEGLATGEIRIANLDTGYTTWVGTFPRMDGFGFQTELDAFAFAINGNATQYLPLIGGEK